MPEALTDAIELAVGIVCLAVATTAARRGLRAVAAVFAVAGIAATAHAVWSLLT
jgi:hypothetical protein